MLKVLVPVDGSRTRCARCVTRSPNTGATTSWRLHLLNVQPRLSRHISRFVSRRDREAGMRDRADAALSAAVALLAEAGVPHQTHWATGERAEEICRAAEQLGVHHIVMGTARKNSITRMLEDSVTHRVLETTPVPVEVVTGERSRSGSAGACRLASSAPADCCCWRSTDAAARPPRPARRLHADELVGQPHVDRRERLGLGDLEQVLARQLEQRDEGDDQHRRAARRRRTGPRRARSGGPAGARRTMLMCSRTLSCSRVIWWCWFSLARLSDVGPGVAQVVGVDVGEALAPATGRSSTWARRKSRPSSGSASSRAAASFICSYSIRRRTSSARGSSASSPSARLLRRQQHARLDLDQHRRHQQVVAGELEVGACGSARRRRGTGASRSPSGCRGC